jgi:hypothetical protein
MKWRVRKPGAKYRAKKRWHLWFAWYPVRVPTNGRMSGQKKVWLEKVYRKGEYVLSYESCYWFWEYKLKGE